MWLFKLLLTVQNGHKPHSGFHDQQSEQQNFLVVPMDAIALGSCQVIPIKKTYWENLRQNVME